MYDEFEEFEKTEEVSFDVSKEEFEELEMIAAKHNMSAKDYVALRIDQIFKRDKETGYFTF